MLENLQTELKQRYNIRFENEALLAEALTQANYINEHPGYVGRDYQRLEFLGDAIMQHATADYLFRRYPDWDEGRLTELRIAMVQTRSFAALSRELHLDQYVRLGHGEEISGARNRDRLLEDIFEAFMGALHLDQGQAVVDDFLAQIMFVKIDEGFYDQFVDYKSKLQEHLQRNGGVAITYTKLSEETLVRNERRFTVSVTCGDEELAIGVGSSTKEAEKAAARLAYQKLTQGAPN